jgi:hypothetical protein
VWSEDGSQLYDLLYLGNIWRGARAQNAAVRCIFDCSCFTISTSGEGEADWLSIYAVSTVD